MVRIERRGRPRRAPRSPADAPLDVASIAAAMPHRRAVRRPERRGDPRAETCLGRLFLNDAITELQYDTGVRFRLTVRRWRNIVGAPRPDRGATPLDGARPGRLQPITEERRQRALDEFMGAWELLRDYVGASGAQELIALCDYDEPPMENVIDMYRSCLNLLGKYYGLRSR